MTIVERTLPMKRLLLLILCFTLVAAAQTKPFAIEDLYKLKSVSGITFSPDGKRIAIAVTESFLATGKTNSELYLMNADGSNSRMLTPAGGNSQGPSISPDGQWVAFTSYFDLYGDDHGCEIYIIRIDGADLRRLTNNDYCDYQPRWGP